MCSKFVRRWEGVGEALEDLAGIACEKKNAKRRRKILGDGIIAMKLLLLHEQ